MSDELLNNPVGELVRKAETDFITGTTTISKYVERSMYDDLNQIDAYLNSRFTTGSEDSLGREKPFFNIVLAARNIWFRATDIDRKNIRIKAGKSKDLIASFLATVHLQDWMRRTNFGQFLNDWGLTLASYGSAVTKFVEKGGKLYPMVIPWNRLIVDAIDFDANPKIEVLELTPAQLKQREGFDKDIVEELIKAQTTRETLDRQQKDQKANYIKLYEVHGELPLSYLTGKEKDEDEYVQQMHIISFVANKKTGRFDDYTLVSGREEKDPYMITHLIKSEGQTLSIGAVQNLFEAQWMVNHSVKSIKDQLDLASKLIFQTADPSFVGQNALSNIETGQILVWNKEIQNGQITQVANNSHDITSLQNYQNQWMALAKEITSTPDILAGQNMPSGTAFRQAAIIQQEAHSNFEIMTENKGLAIEYMVRTYIIPHLKKKMNTSKEISATLESNDITKLDSIYIPKEAIKRFNRKAVEAVLNETELPDLGQEMQGVKQDLGKLGNQRFFIPSEVSDTTWSDIFKDLEWDVIVEVTNENTDKEATMTTLSTVLQTIATNPMVLQDPNAKMLFNKILEETGRVSPIELSTIQQPTQPAMVGQGSGVESINQMQPIQ